MRQNRYLIRESRNNLCNARNPLSEKRHVSEAITQLIVGRNLKVRKRKGARREVIHFNRLEASCICCCCCCRYRSAAALHLRRNFSFTCEIKRGACTNDYHVQSDRESRIPITRIISPYFCVLFLENLVSRKRERM